MVSNGRHMGSWEHRNTEMTPITLDIECPAEDDTTEIVEDNSHGVTYKVEDVPPLGIILSFGLQNVLLNLAPALTTAYVIGDVLCASPDHPIRAKLFCTTLFMAGLSTFLQCIVGIRLPVFQTVCSTFLIPLLAMRTNPSWKCPPLQDAALNTTITNTTVTVAVNDEEAMYRKLREMMGCLMLSSLVEVFIGATGLIGFCMRYIGPIAIAPVVSLIGISLYKIPLEYARVHWGLSALCIVICVVLMMYLDWIRLPCPTSNCCQRGKGVSCTRVPVFQMFPILFSVLITWGVCGIMTHTNSISDDPTSLEYRARTDIRLDIIYNTPWFYIPYPGQFGSPLFNTTIFVGFLAAVLSSVLESIGDYYATAAIARAPPPPAHAVNRGILLEGLGSVLSGAMGAGHATTSSTGHVALLGISKMGSRFCMAMSGILCILLSVVGKIGAVLSTMPDPPIGGSIFVTFGILTAIGIFALRSVDMSSSRNLAVFGISLYVGIVIPAWFDWYPDAVETGNETIDGVVKGLFGTPMFIGGIVAIFLDNTVRGTRKERGFIENEDADAKVNAFVTSERDAYDLPWLSGFLGRFKSFRKIPFLPPYHHK